MSAVSDGHRGMFHSVTDVASGRTASRTAADAAAPQHARSCSSRTSAACQKIARRDQLEAQEAGRQRQRL